MLGRLDVSTVEPGGDPDVTVVRSLDYDVRGRLIQETRTTAEQPARARHFDHSDPSGEGVFMSQQWDDVDGAITLSKTQRGQQPHRSNVRDEHRNGPEL